MVWRWICCLLLLASTEVLAKGSSEAKVSFAKGTLTISGHKLQVEIAETAAQHERGLMFRQKLADGEGMIFIFDEEAPRAFWMKNTFVNLSIGYFDRNKTLIDIQDMKAVGSIMETPESYPSRGAAQYALEVPQGWFARKKIKIGAKFELKRL
jgi:uncharacterized membrane protein (UPF0127 family)